MELSIDTSSNVAGIALSREGEVFAEQIWQTARNHSTELIPNIEQLLKQQAYTMQSCIAIMVATGPGSFNGLRVGISAAKGFSLALNIPIVGINTLEIEAYGFAFSGLPICSVHNAGREEIATALYRQTDDWLCLQEPHITTIDTLCQQTIQPTIFCGEIPERALQQLRQKLGDRAIIPDIVHRIRHTSYLATLGWRRFNKRSFDDPVTLQPLYLRQPPITQRKVK